MKKSIFLFFAAILCTIGMNAATPEKLYLTPSSDWNKDNPRFAAYFFDNGEKWVSMTKVAGETNLYEVTVPTDKAYPKVIFCRMNPNAAANNWDNKWNQTGDLAIPTDGKNHFTVPNGTWNGATTTWSTYTPASTEEPEVPTEPVKYTWTVAGTPASVFEVEWNPEHAANDMVEQADGTYKWEKTNIEFADESSSVQFKVCQEHAWTVAHPGSNYELNISGAGIYTVTITFNTNGNTVNAVATKTGEYVGEAPTHTYSVTGSNADLFGTAWDPAVEANLMETADNVTYTWEKEGVTLMGNFEMKVVQDKAFSVAYPAQNKVVEITEPAIYTVSITFNATSHDIDVNLTKTGEAVIPPVKLYFVNIGNWTDLKAYVWADGGNPYKAWEESESMTDTGDDVYGFDVYSYEFPSNYNRIIFKGANDQKTSDNAYDAAKPYYCNGVWYASLSEIPAPESLTYTVTVPEGTEECWIAGEMNNWTLTKMNPGAAANQFTLDIVGAAIDHEYKYACKNDWAYAEVREADENENSNRKAWTALDEVTAWGKPAVYTYYLMGVNGDWTTGIKMEVNTGAENEVMLTCQPVNGEIKIKRVGDDESEYWYGGKSLKEEEGNLGSNTESDTDGDGNIALEEGIYNFYFNTADGKLWIASAIDCETEPEGGTATITLVDAKESGATLTLSADEYVVGDEITASASHYDDGFAFAYWKEGDVIVSYSADYTFTVDGDRTLDAYFGANMPVEMRDLAVDGDAMTITGSNAMEEVATSLVLGDYNGDTEMFAVDASASSISFRGYDLTILYSEVWLDVLAYSMARAKVVAGFGDELFVFNLTMSAAVEAHNIVVTDAILSEQPGGFLYMNSTWSDGETTYPVQAEIPGFDASVADATYMVTITIGGWGDEDPWLGFGEGEGTVTVNEDVVTLTASILNAMTGFAADVTISGSFPDYTRPVALNQWGTICLPNASSNFTGATFYEVSSLDPAKGLWLDQLEDGAQLEAGKPYIFQATATEIAVVYTGAAKSDPVAGANGLTGTFTDIAAGGVLVDNYIIANNAVWVANENNDLPANRAYINAASVPTETQAEIPGRRRVCMGENATTGLDQIVAPAGQAVKAIENGQLIIIRDGVKYNVQGQVIR